MLLEAATSKLSRLVAKDTVRSFIQAPFAVYREHGVFSKLKEKCALFHAGMPSRYPRLA